MKIIVVSKGDERRWHTLKLLADDDIKCIVVAHTDEVADKIKKAFPMHSVRSSSTKELVDKRNWILKNLLYNDEWFIGMDDNIRAFTMVRKTWREKDTNDVTKSPPGSWETWRQIYNHKVSPHVWLREFEKDIEKAHNERIPLVGVSVTENPYFRSKRYSNYKALNTKVYAMQNKENLHFKHKFSHDAYLCTLCVALYGKILIDSYLHPIAKFGEVGGLGPREERVKQGLIEIHEEIVKSFPGLVVRGRGKTAGVKFRLTSEKSVRLWREQHGYLGRIRFPREPE